MFRTSNFAKKVGFLLCLPFNILSILFIPIFIISARSKSNNKILWKIYNINKTILSKIFDIKKYIYEDICGWYYGNSLFL